MAQFPFVPVGDLRELKDDIRQLFADLDSHLAPDQRVYSGECHPVLDVLETSAGVEILLDVSGIPADALRVLFRNDVVLIAGEKAPSRAVAGATFHLVEREFGRFVRAVRLTGAFEATGGRAWLDSGELTIVIPRRPDRRGKGHPIPITSSRGPA